MQTPVDPMLTKLIDAALPHVAFDGWGEEAFRAAVADIGLDPEQAKQVCPRGAVDLAVGFHKAGDHAMQQALAQADLGNMRYSEKVAHAIRLRLDAVDDKEAVRRGSTLFSLPHMAPEGARLIWGTADAIWSALGDTSDDVNWYTKRATLSAVYSAVVLYWLGDDSVDGQATDAFIDRRIADVMQVERMKAAVRKSPALKPFTAPLDRLASMIKPPRQQTATDLPGMWRDPD
ncbi:MAG: COQ9 family protein [Pseudomonadota bacterium]